MKNNKVPVLTVRSEVILRMICAGLDHEKVGQISEETND